jgi:hypothetical protein
LDGIQDAPGGSGLLITTGNRVGVGSDVLVGSKVLVGRIDVAVDSAPAMGIMNAVALVFEAMGVVSAGADGFRMANGTLHRQQKMKRDTPPINDLPRIPCLQNALYDPLANCCMGCIGILQLDDVRFADLLPNCEDGCATDKLKILTTGSTRIHRPRYDGRQSYLDRMLWSGVILQR